MFRKNRKIKVIAICAAAALTVAVFAGASSANGESGPAEEVKKDILVDTVSPEIGDVVVVGEYIGTMEPSQQVVVYPRVSAEVLSVNFNVGDTVRAGDVLFELDSKTLRTSISQTEAALASAKAKAQLNLDMARNNLDTQDFNVENGYENNLKSASNAVDSAQSAVNNAQKAVDSAENRLLAANAGLRTAKRQLREFREDNIFPPSMVALEYAGVDEQVEAQLRDAVIQAELSVEAAELGVEQAKLGLEQAKDGLDKARDGYETAKVMVDEQRVNINNQVELAELNTNFSDQDIAIQKLKSDLSYYTVTAPIGGVIEQRSIDPFDMAAPQAPAFIISDKNSMTVSFKIPQSSYAHMSTGGKITLEKDGASYTGTITEISTMVDSSGLFTIKANVPNPPAGLYTGASVKIYAEAQKAENAVLIPLSALYYDNGAPFVYIAENGRAKKVPVTVGIYDSQNIQIISGVSMSDRIISTWSASLADGVEIVPASGANNTSSPESAADAETAQSSGESDGGARDGVSGASETIGNPQESGQDASPLEAVEENSK